MDGGTGIATGIDGEIAASNNNIEQNTNKINYNDEHITQDWDDNEKRDRISDYQSNLICDDNNDSQDDKSYYEDNEGGDSDIDFCDQHQELSLIHI